MFDKHPKPGDETVVFPSQAMDPEHLLDTGRKLSSLNAFSFKLYVTFDQFTAPKTTDIETLYVFLYHPSLQKTRKILPQVTVEKETTTTREIF